MSDAYSHQNMNDAQIIPQAINDPYMETLGDPNIPFLRRFWVIQKLDEVNLRFGV